MTSVISCGDRCLPVGVTPCEEANAAVHDADKTLAAAERGLAALLADPGLTPAAKNARVDGGLIQIRPLQAAHQLQGVNAGDGQDVSAGIALRRHREHRVRDRAERRRDERLVQRLSPAAVRLDLAASQRLYCRNRLESLARLASTLIAANLNPKVIQARLGYATITETMDTYFTCSPTRKTSAAGSSTLSSRWL
jgi:hypothetical protein